MSAQPARDGVAAGAEKVALREGVIVGLESAPGLVVPAVVHRAAADRVRLEVLAGSLGAPVGPGHALALSASGSTGVERARAVIDSVAEFPLVDVRILGAPAIVARTPGAQIALAFPVRYEIVPPVASAIAGRVRARIDAGVEAGRAGGEPAELAFLALAKMMTRLDARFDRILDAQANPSAPQAGNGDGDTHEVLIFSLAKMMLTRLDEKFDRLLASMRDPAVLSRPAVDTDESIGPVGLPPAQMLVLQALTRLMESLGEKFERVVAAIEPAGRRLRLEHAWGLAVGEEGVVLGLAAPLAIGAVVDLELRLPFFPPLPLLAFGRVDAVTDHPEDVPERRFRAAVSFVAMPEADREIVVQLVLRKQREQLRARHLHTN